MFFIQYWNNPNMIFLLIPLFAGMLGYVGTVIWSKLRPYIVACAFGAAERRSAKPIVIRLIATGFAELCCLTLFLALLPDYAIFGNFIVSFIGCIVLARLQLFYGLHLLKRFGMTNAKVSRNFGAFTERSNVRRSYLFVASMALLIVALMEPYGKEKATHLQRNTLRATIAFDLSRSMDAKDYTPSRFDAARDEVIRLLSAAQGDQIGIVFFTHEIVAKIPQTLDLTFITAVLNEIDPSELGARGTDLNVALNAAMSAFAESADNANEVPDNGRKRILLVTDGEDHSGDIEQTIQTLIRRRIHVDIIAVGTENGAEVFDNQNAPMRFENMPVISRIQTDFLKQLAQRTQGFFTLLSMPDSASSQVLAQWNDVRIDMTPQKETSAYYRRPLHGYFISAAFVLALVFFFYPIFVFMAKRLTALRPADRSASPK